ncbi:MAG TPA: glycosyltransferase family 87 protein [Chloroflexota bacterium]|nr:glycosyltransferase family 87 protein [Chloroflexota bacterium]
MTATPVAPSSARGIAVPSTTSSPWPVRDMAGTALALIVGFTACFVALSMNGGLRLEGWDVFYDYVAGQMVLAGHGAQLYAPGVYHHFMVVHDHVNASGEEVYPPIVALCAALPALLPYHAAYFVFLGYDCILLAVALSLLLQYASVTGRALFWMRLAAVISAPVMVALVQGQLSITLLTAVVLGMVCLLRGQDLRAGLALGILFIAPEYVVPFGLLLLLQRRWRALGGMAAIAAFVLLIPSLALRPGIYGSYARALQAATHYSAAVGGFNPIVNWSIAGVVQSFWPSHSINLADVALTLAVLAAFVIWLRRPRPLDIAMGLAVIVALLTSQHALIHSLSLALVPAAVIWRRRRLIPGARAELVTAYLAMTPGFLLSLMAPLHLPTVGLLALGTGVYTAGERHSNDD